MDTVFKNIETVNLFGVNIAVINMPVLIDTTVKYLNEMRGKYICVSNVHTTITAYDDANYRDIQNSSILNIPDGGPLSTIGRWLGHTEMSRTFGPEYMIEIMKESESKGYRHFLYGSTRKTISKLKENIKRDYPNACIVGQFSPPFRDLSGQEDQKIIKLIKECNPDFIWVALGAPKQEKWM